MLFLLFAPARDTKPPSGAWDPQLQRPGAEQLYRAYSLIAWAYALDTSLMRLPSKLDRPASLSDKIDRGNLRELRHWVDAAKDARALDGPEALAVQAWTVYALGLVDGRSEELERAGALYESAPDVSLPDGAEASIRWKRWQAASLAYQDAGALERALQAACRWAASTKDPSPAYRKIAEICWRLGRFEEAMNAFENATGDAAAERDWQDSLILALGLEKLQGDAVARAIAHSASGSPFKEHGLELVAWFLPWVRLLGGQSRERLWFGLYTISSAEILANTGQAGWDAAGANFGESLAFELKGAVFKPFFQQHSDLALPDQFWQRVHDGTGTLGQLVQILLQSRVPLTSAARTLRTWLEQNHPKLVDEISRNNKKLIQAHQLRDAAQHEQLNPDGVRELFETVCLALKAIHARR